MKSQIESEIKSRISEFVVELDRLVRKSTLEALHGVLGNGSAAPLRRGRPAGMRGPGRKKGAGRRSSADVGEAAEKLLAHVKANDGLGIGALSQATGLDLKVAKKAAAQLLAEGQLKKSGQKRGTVYQVGSGKPARAAKRGKRRGKKSKAA